MLWFILALAAGLMDAIYHAQAKRWLGDIPPVSLAAGVQITASIILLTCSFIKGMPVIGGKFLVAVLITSLLNVVAIVLLFKALQQTDLSLASPLISLTPLFLIGTSFIILGEKPSMLGIFGMILITLGSLVLGWSGGKPQLKGILMMLSVAVIYSISANFDKIALMSSDYLFEPGVVCGIIGLVFLVWCIPLKQRFPRPSQYAPMGLTVAAGAIFVNLAYGSQIVPYIISVKRMGILFSVIIGWLIFKEKKIGWRIGGAALMLLGGFLLALYPATYS